MRAETTARLVALHARLVLDARQMEASGRRMHDAGEIDRAELTADMAAELRQEAAAIADALAGLGADVLIPEPGQLSLFGDGTQ
jgi:hypothetical protein